MAEKSSSPQKSEQELPLLFRCRLSQMNKVSLISTSKSVIPPVLNRKTSKSTFLLKNRPNSIILL